MSKITKLILFTAFLLVSGWVYVSYYQPESVQPVAFTGKVVNIEMRSVENEWTFCWIREEGGECTTDPIEAIVGDKVIIGIFNEDTFDHGWALEAFGINRRLFPKQTTTIEFVAARPGTYQFYCSVPCGDGHYSQTGTIIIHPQDKSQDEPAEEMKMEADEESMIDESNNQTEEETE